MHPFNRRTHRGAPGAVAGVGRHTDDRVIARAIIGSSEQ
jgi:hypothetical protein